MILRASAVVVSSLVGGLVVSRLRRVAGPVLTRRFEGISNGALYALIALGYTLVYGIIELINFAHGDLFMLGTVFARDS